MVVVLVAKANKRTMKHFFDDETKFFVLDFFFVEFNLLFRDSDAMFL
jgi:hypothetical protein